MHAQRKSRYGVALVGAGAFGARRAAAVGSDSRSELLAVADPNFSRARELGAALSAMPYHNYRQAIERHDIEIVVVATPTVAASEITFTSLVAGRHVLVEKPFGRNADEVLPSVEFARDNNLFLKVGYNHRYHPALAKAHALFMEGAVGRLLHLRCVYGHGGRPGYEQEWRSRPEISGGGQLLDQGVHALDLFRWFAGEFAEASAFLATSHWPIAPAEDNAFALLRTSAGVVAQLHASWTQWKNAFSFDVVGDKGALAVSGLGRSYGPERLTLQTRAEAGGAPAEQQFDFPGEDNSLALEWSDFLDCLEHGREPMSSGADAWKTLQLVDALYLSARDRRVVQLASPSLSQAAAQPAELRIA